MGRKQMKVPEPETKKKKMMMMMMMKMMMTEGGLFRKQSKMGIFVDAW